MKRIKLMLTAMIVLGTVGGVLAFKSVRSTKYCTAATINGVCAINLKCTGSQVGRVDATGAPKCTISTAATANCVNDEPFCGSTPARITTD